MMAHFCTLYSIKLVLDCCNPWYIGLRLLNWRAGTQLLSTTMGVKEYVQSEFQKVEDEIILPNKQLFPSPFTLDDFFWAFGILRSRAFSRLRGQSLVLIPLADFVSWSIYLWASSCSNIQNSSSNITIACLTRPDTKLKVLFFIRLTTVPG
jgi:hypothetical protein